MADITLSDYLAFILSEISRARDMADRYTREIALMYAKDDVLRHFSVPRFKLSKMELNIPVLVSGVEVSSLMQFHVSREDFRSYLLRKLIDLVVLVRRGTTVVTSPPSTTNGAKPIRTDGIEPLIDVFYDRLVSLPDPSHPENVISDNWSSIAAKVLTINEIPIQQINVKPISDLIGRPLPGLIDDIKSQISVTKTTIERLMINAQTNVVKDGSSDTSVFTIKAELIEEGVIIKSVKDETTGVVSSVVEFE
jgi:hypothetical protein